MPGLVDITLPSGEAATVPREDLSQALAAGATQVGPVAPKGSDDPAGGLLGQAAAGIFGAGSTGTFGLSDAVLGEGSYLLGGKQFHKQVLGEVNRVKQANPLTTMAGEAAGLFINPTISHIGEAAESAIASRVGGGLLGSVASMGARGAAEGAALGAQHQISEDALGDHEYNGEAIFASAAKDALLGGAFGAALGGAGYGVKSAVGGLLKRSPGPVSDAALDEIAGVEGAGRKVEAAARADQDAVEGLRKTGMTSPQASQMVDELNGIAKEAAGGPFSQIGNDMVESHIDQVAKTNPKLGADMRQLWRNKTAGVHEAAAQTLNDAAAIARDGTRSLRDIEDLANDVQFRQKPEKIGKFVDRSLVEAQRDQFASALQSADDVLSFWEGTATKGGAEGAIKTLRKSVKDAQSFLEKANPAGENYSRDLFVKMNGLKQAADAKAQWGKSVFGLPEAITHGEMGLEPLANKLRAGLEDTSVWGEAGSIQAQGNATFSNMKYRRDDMLGRLGVAIDRGVGGHGRLPEIDIEKAHAMLNSFTGTANDEMLQSVKSIGATVDGWRDRAAFLREFGDLTPAESKRLEEGLASLKRFEDTVKSARERAAVTNRMKQSLAEERDGGHIGGLVGLFADAVSKPLTTIQRLAHVQQTVSRVERGIAAGFRKFFGGSGGGETAARVASKVMPRDKAKVAKEIGDIAELRGNPAAMQARADKMVGDLGNYAPKTANEVKLTAVRALDYLAREAPRAVAPIGLAALDMKNGQKARYSDQQISEWEAKRQAALDPESVVRDMQRGKINRDTIKAVEFVSPKLFARMQEMAQEQIQKLAAEGKLDQMPYQQRAVIATFLKVPPDATWRPDFISMMQSAKTTNVAESAPKGPPQPNSGVSKREVQVDHKMFATASDTIEGKAA